MFCAVEVMPCIPINIPIVPAPRKALGRQVLRGDRDGRLADRSPAACRSEHRSCDPSPSTQSIMAEASRPGKRRSTMRTWLENTGLATKKTVSIEHGKWQDFNPADLLAKQSDMLEQMQHIMIEERWQHEQHTRVLETNLENLHKIIESYEKGELSPRSAVAVSAPCTASAQLPLDLLGPARPPLPPPFTPPSPIRGTMPFSVQ